MEHELDYSVNRVTAFDDYADLVQRCRTGYVPTLRRKGCTLKIGMQLVKDGFRVFWLK